MYVDLSVNAKFNGQRDQVNFMNRVIELGYGAIAWNRTVTGNLNGNKLVPVTPIAINPKMINNNTNRVLSGVNTGIQCNSCQLHVPEPIVSPLTSNNIVQPTSSTAEIKQYVRLTYIVDEISEAQCLTSSNACLQQYDIVAAVPGNNKVLSYLCKTADIDIISFNFTQRLPMSLDKKMLDEAVRRGIHFEITYAPIITGSSNNRKEILSNTKMLISYLRGKHIIFSSGADGINHLRGPFDVTNVAQMLDIKREQALLCNKQNTLKVLQHGEARRNKYSQVKILHVAKISNSKRKRIESYSTAVPNDDSDLEEDLNASDSMGCVLASAIATARPGAGEEDADSEEMSEDENEAALLSQLKKNVVSFNKPSVSLKYDSNDEFLGFESEPKATTSPKSDKSLNQGGKLISTLEDENELYVPPAASMDVDDNSDFLMFSSASVDNSDALRVSGTLGSNQVRGNGTGLKKKKKRKKEMVSF